MHYRKNELKQILFAFLYIIFVWIKLNRLFWVDSVETADKPETQLMIKVLIKLSGISLERETERGDENAQ